MRGDLEMSSWRRALGVSVICTHLAVVSPFVHAGMVSTEAAVAPAVTSATLLRALDRESVQAQLLAHGVTVEQARARVAALTDQEIAHLAQRYQSEPAGGFVELVIYAFLAWAVLHATDYGGIFMNDEKKAE